MCTLVMESFLLCIYFVYCVLASVTVNCQSHGGMYSNPFMTKKESLAFLQRNRERRSTNCLNENVCEENQEECSTHAAKEELCKHKNCPNGQECTFPRPCHPECKDINKCNSKPCKNGATCNNKANTYTCTCVPGWTGVNCQENINKCNSNPCKNGATCNNKANAYTCTCVPGWTGVNCQENINECNSNPCKNGATCNNEANKYTCTCVPGWTGVNCQENINECESNPCHVNSTCRDDVNKFFCVCPPKMYGTLCDTDVCRPTPADVVFVLDSSSSMLESQFKKQLEFVANFTDNVIIGPRDFQISVITFSFDAHVEFFLNRYTDNVMLKKAVANIRYRPGATFTDKGLEMVNTVFSAGHGIERRVNKTQAARFVYLLTDGMSTLREKTKIAAKHLKDIYSVTLTAVGIGEIISQEELVDIASKSNGQSSVYSVNNFNSLYTLLKQLVQLSCEECSHSAKSDIAVVIDTSDNITVEQYQARMVAVTHLVDLMELDVNKARVSVTTFDTKPSTLFGFDWSTDKVTIKTELNGIIQSSQKRKMNIVDVLDFVDNNTLMSFARTDARKFVILFSNGHFDKVSAVKLQQVKAKLESENTTAISIGSGNDVNYEGLLSLVTDNFHVFQTSTDDIPTNLNVLTSSFVYNICDIKKDTEV